MRAPEMKVPGGNRALRQNSKADSGIIGDPDAHYKPLRTLQAVAALHGIAVHELADGSLLVTRWGFSRALPDVRAATVFLAQQGIHA